MLQRICLVRLSCVFAKRSDFE